MSNIDFYNIPENKILFDSSAGHTHDGNNSAAVVIPPGTITASMLSSSLLQYISTGSSSSSSSSGNGFTLSAGGYLNILVPGPLTALGGYINSNYSWANNGLIAGTKITFDGSSTLRVWFFQSNDYGPGDIEYYADNVSSGFIDNTIWYHDDKTLSKNLWFKIENLGGGQVTNVTITLILATSQGAADVNVVTGVTTPSDTTDPPANGIINLVPGVGVGIVRSGNNFIFSTAPINNPNGTPPPVPGVTGLAATTGIDPTTGTPYINVTWTYATQAGVYFEVYCDQDNGSGNTILINSGQTTDTKFTFSNLLTNQLYDIYVNVITSSGQESSTSSIQVTTSGDPTIPGAPTGVAIAGGLASLNVSWTADAAIPKILNYTAEIDTVNTFNSANLQTKVVTTNFAFFNITPSNSTYYARVKATSTSNVDSPWSAIASGASLLVTATDVTPGSVVSTLLGQVYITGSDIAAGTITGPNILAGTITGNLVAANTIQGENLTIVGTNLADNGNFDYLTSGSPNGWTINGTMVAGGANAAANALKITADSTTHDNYNLQYVPVSPGDQIYAECWLKADAGSNGTAYGIGFFGYQNATGTLSATNPYNAVITEAASGLTTTWTKFSANWTVPPASDIRYIRTWCSLRSDATTGAVYYSGLVWRRATTGVEIANGAVTAQNIAAGTILGNNIASNTITTSQLSIVGSNLVDNPNFDYGVGSVATGWSAGTWVNTGGANSSPNALQLSASQTSLNDAFIQVSPGDQLFVSGFIKGDSGITAGNAYIDVIGYATTAGSSTSTTHAVSVAGTSIPTAWQATPYSTTTSGGGSGSTAAFTYSNFTVPAGVNYVKLQCTLSSITAGKNVYFSNIVCRRSIQAVEIGNGAITADQIGANTIVGSKILAGSITASNAVFAAAAIQDADINTLTAAKITTGTLQASANITCSGTIQASSGGNNVIIGGSYGFQIWQGPVNTGTKVMDINASGSAIFSGTVSAATIQGSTITTSGTVSGYNGSYLSGITMNSGQITFTGNGYAGGQIYGSFESGLGVGTLTLYGGQTPYSGGANFAQIDLSNASYGTCNISTRNSLGEINLNGISSFYNRAVDMTRGSNYSFVSSTSSGVIQGATTVVTTDASGQATIYYPTAFPNSIQSCVVCNGDWNGGIPVVVSLVGFAANNNSAFVIQADYNGSPLTSSSVRVNWIAVGS